MVSFQDVKHINTHIGVIKAPRYSKHNAVDSQLSTPGEKSIHV